MTYFYQIVFIAACLGLSQGCAASPSTAPPQITATSTSAQSVPALSQAQRFENWKARLIEEAVTKGYDRRMIETLMKQAVINELALDRDKSQPEFTKPVWAYVDNALGRHDIVSALSTFAFEGRRKAFGTQQLYALFDMVAAGDVRPEQLTGSWAGAMGMTQFIPTTFRDYAVDFDNDGNKDLWTNRADALGSAAHYLARHGWRKSEPTMTEVRVPANFDYALLETTKKTVNEWTALGVGPINGQRWSAEAGFLEAKMIAPGGHRGPKILTFKNFDDTTWFFNWRC